MKRCENFGRVLPESLPSFLALMHEVSLSQPSRESNYERHSNVSQRNLRFPWGVKTYDLPTVQRVTSMLPEQTHLEWVSPSIKIVPSTTFITSFHSAKIVLSAVLNKELAVKTLAASSLIY